MKNIVKKLNGMNRFTAFGLSGIIIFKCNLDHFGVWMWVPRLGIGCKGGAFKHLNIHVPQKRESSL